MKRIIIILLVVLGFVKFTKSQTIAITEIMYNSDSTLQSKNWVELYNYGTASVNISNWILRDETAINFFTVPSATSIAAGSYLVLAQRLDTFMMVYPSVSNVIGSFEFGLDNTSGSVRIYDADDNLVKSVNYVDSLPWPNGADGLGPSLQINDETGDANDPTNWFAGCIGGSPGVAYTPCDYSIVVSEINYHSADDFDMKNWIELWNHTNNPINISNWKFRDNNINNIFTFPSSTTLDAGERLVICDSLPAMNSLWPFVSNIIGEFDFGLSNNGDGVRLYDASDKLQYSVRYDDELPWPADADGLGYTLELLSEGINPNLASSWFAGCPHGSPGSEFTLPCGVSIEETGLETNITVSPNPFSNSVHFTIHEHIVAGIEEIFIVNLFGQKIITLALANTFTWDGKDVAGNEVSDGFYLLLVRNKNGTFIQKEIAKQ
ncbi:MAG: lamin tail domain-containing protein [Chitinophagales bacterium]